MKKKKFKKNDIEIYIDDTPIDLTGEPKLTDEEYEQFREETRKYVKKQKNKKAST